MSKWKIKSAIFIFSSAIIYLMTPDFIWEEVTKKCIVVYFIGIFYVALAFVDLYEFYIGEQFSIGIQMYRINSLEEDGSKFNIFHRRIGAVVRLFLAIAVFIALFKVEGIRNILCGS